MGVEQMVKVHAPKISIFYRIGMILLCIIVAITIPQSKLLGVVLLVIMGFSTVLVFEYYNAEYEYSIVDGVISIDKIMAKSVRRKVASFDVSRATLVAKVNSQAALGKAMQKLRTYNCSSGIDDPNDLVIYTYETETNEMVRLFILPNDSMLEEIKASAAPGSYKE